MSAPVHYSGGTRRAHPAELAAAATEAEADAAQPLAPDPVVVVANGESLDPVVVEHERQARLRRWQEIR